MPTLDVYRSGAGLYVGTYYDLRPYTRESGSRPRELARPTYTGAYGR